MNNGLRAAGISLALLIWVTSARAQNAPKAQALSGYKVAMIIVQPPFYWQAKNQEKQQQPPPQAGSQTIKVPEFTTQKAWSDPPAEDAKLRFMEAVGMAQDFRKQGADVQMIFRGPAVLWLSLDESELKGPGHNSGKGPKAVIAKLRALGVKVWADQFAGKHFGVSDKVSQASETANSDADVPHAATLAAQGYQILIF